MPRVIKVKDDYRHSDLSFTPGGSTVKVINKSGETLIYDKIKSPSGYCNKILKLGSNIDKIYVNDSLYYDSNQVK
jgi:hypothetical protein